MRRTTILFLSSFFIILGVFSYLFKDFLSVETFSLAEIKNITIERAQVWARRPANFMREKKKTYDKFASALEQSKHRKKDEEELESLDKILAFANKNLGEKVPGEPSWHLIPSLRAFNRFETQDGRLKKSSWSPSENTLYVSRNFFFEERSIESEEGSLVLFNPNRLSFAVITNKMLVEFDNIADFYKLTKNLNLLVVKNYYDDESVSQIKWAIVEPKEKLLRTDVFIVLSDIMKQKGIHSAYFEKSYLHEKKVK